MKSRLIRRKSLTADKLRIFLNVLLILVVAGVNFQIIPNINTYINTKHPQIAMVKPVKASYTNDKYHGDKSVIDVQLNNHKKWRHHKHERYLRLEITPSDNARDFAGSMDMSAKFIAQEMHRSKLALKDIQIDQTNDAYFDQYGYNMVQFGELVQQHYSGRTENIYQSTNAIEKILNLVAAIIIIVSLLMLIWCIITPKERLKRLV